MNSFIQLGVFSIIPSKEETEEVVFLVACSNVRAVDFCVCVCVGDAHTCGCVSACLPSCLSG